MIAEVGERKAEVSDLKMRTPVIAEVGERKSEVSDLKMRTHVIAEVGEQRAEVCDLKMRTFDFGVRCVKLADALPQTRSGSAIANQLVRCGTSVGANYRAARRARSRAEFVAKLGISEEECDEVLYWIEMIKALGLVAPSTLCALHKEADELLSIIITSIKTTKRNQITKRNG